MLEELQLRAEFVKAVQSHDIGKELTCNKEAFG